MMTRPTTDPRRRTLLIFLFVMAFQQGVTINLLPVLFTNFAETFQLDLQQRGQIQSFFFVGAMAALFASGFVTERIAVRRSALLALGLSGLGSILVAVAPDFLLLRLGAMVLGMGTLWVLSVTSATIAAHFAPQSQRLFMWTMAIFAASGTGAPYGLGHLVSFLEAWRPILFGVGLYLWVSALAITLLFSGSLRDTGLRSRRHGPTPGPRPDGDSLGSGPLRTAPAGWLAGIVRRYRGSLLGQGALLLIGFLVVLDNLTAGNIVAWTPNLCELRFGRSTALAGEIMGANSVGYLVGRVILGLFLTGEPFAKFGSALGQPWVSPWERGRPARILVKALPRRQSAGEPTNPVKPIATTLPSLVRAGRPRSQGSQPFPAINPTYWRILQKAQGAIRTGSCWDCAMPAACWPTACCSGSPTRAWPSP